MCTLVHYRMWTTLTYKMNLDLLQQHKKGQNNAGLIHANKNKWIEPKIYLQNKKVDKRYKFLRSLLQCKTAMLRSENANFHLRLHFVLIHNDNIWKQHFRIKLKQTWGLCHQYDCSKRSLIECGCSTARLTLPIKKFLGC